MSGNFVQRGAPALLPKHLRAEMALKSGADLVIELPVFYACASAEYFAYGARPHSFMPSTVWTASVSEVNVET